jgi:hypothetical protein
VIGELVDWWIGDGWIGLPAEALAKEGDLTLWAQNRAGFG